ncbi:RTA1-domain-containing protein [Aureobasidium subglaciale]|nr:RTA1-domain-containing protein [Aureobasidium subglaciale]
MSDSNDGEINFVLYHYTPSIVAAIIFVVLFGLSFVGHVYYIFKFRALYFIPFTIGVIMECIGYVGRALSHSDKEALGPFIMQSLLLLVAPALYAASIYMVLGRVIRLLDAEEYSVIRTRWLTKVFVIGDVISFLVQSSGAGLQAKGDLASFNLGKNIVIAGLIIQILIFGIFVIVASLFHIRVNKLPTGASVDSNLRWRKHMHNLYICSAIILIRNLIRVIEYAQGNNGYIITHEWMLYIFDGVFMLLVTIAFLVLHPSKLLGNGRIQSRPLSDPQLYAMESGRSQVRSHHRHSQHKHSHTHSHSRHPHRHHQHHSARPRGPRSPHRSSKHGCRRTSREL